MARKIQSTRKFPKRKGKTGIWVEKRDLPPLLKKVQPYTMVPVESMTELARVVRAVITFDIPGSFVECGAWKGGASFLMANMLRQAGVRDRKVWAFDSFEGLPPPQEIDGSEAIAFARNTDSAEYFDNCTASVEQVRRAARKLGLSSFLEIVKGWFEETLPAHRDRIGPIAILRIDGNWYASVRCCLDTLFDQVVGGGFVLFHTYYTYEGCAIAAHEFLGNRKLGYPLEGIVGMHEDIPDFQSALFRKSTTTWKAMQQEYLAAEAITALIPPGETVILADQEQWENKPQGRFRLLPFLESDGEYYGPPENDADAVDNLEKLRQEGAGYLVIGWPAFWWLEYYAKFHRFLRTRFQCLREDERVIVFKLT
jgi:O-methyltransferase